jgi:large subunit ribosomal protein L24
MKIKKDDTVFIISGKDLGKNGQVQKVLIDEKKVVVTGINIAKKHLKPSRKNPHGGIIDMAKPLDISNVEVLCPHCGKPTRVGYKITKNMKERICRKCQGNLDVKETNVKS